jgi:NAD(P)-dependent dehydrogenase (short-subunit alcohol dehydrogenase family)
MKRLLGKRTLMTGGTTVIAQQVQSQVPLGRFGLPEEIARAALFLTSDDSDFCPGTEPVADGGMSTL